MYSGVQIANDAWQNAESTILMILAKALKEQTDDEAECGRVALLEYKDGAACDEKQFESSDDLRQFLDSVQRHQSVESSGGATSFSGIVGLALNSDL